MYKFFDCVTEILANREAINRMFIDNMRIVLTTMRTIIYSNPEKPWRKKKYLTVSWRPWLAGACVWLGLEVNSAGTLALQDQRSPSLP